MALLLFSAVDGVKPRLVDGLGDVPLVGRSAAICEGQSAWPWGHNKMSRRKMGDVCISCFVCYASCVGVIWGVCSTVYPCFSSANRVVCVFLPVVAFTDLPTPFVRAIYFLIAESFQGELRLPVNSIILCPSIVMI